MFGEHEGIANKVSGVEQSQKAKLSTQQHNTSAASIKIGQVSGWKPRRRNVVETEGWDGVEENEATDGAQGTVPVVRPVRVADIRNERGDRVNKENKIIPVGMSL